MIMQQNTRIFTLSAVVGSMSITAGFSQAKSSASETEQRPMNILFLMSDDMRTELNVYGSKIAKTPHLDKLAHQGIRFERAYCQFPLSGPSRTSLLTGRRPTTSDIYTNREWYGDTYPDWVSLPKYFRQNGYITLRSGKIFHSPVDDTEAWIEGGTERNLAPFDKEPLSYVSPADFHVGIQSRTLRLTPVADHQDLRGSDKWEAVEGDEANHLQDTQIADKAIEYIKRSKETGQPFFIACGFRKPHTPLKAPKDFFDLYAIEDMALPPDFASLLMVPFGFPEASVMPFNGDMFMDRMVSPEEAREMLRAYLACVSYVDWNVGRVIAELERQGLRENTIIVFASDHGYQLGEKGKWSKHCSLWEHGARVPFIIHDPRAKGNGKSSPRIVEMIDIYPTLADICGLPQPNGLDGTSLAPLLENPNMEWNRPAYTVTGDVGNGLNKGNGIIGVVVRTERWRYAEFFGPGAGAFLTDPINDPHELKNLIYDPKYKDVVSELQKLALKHVEGKTVLNTHQ